jgi:hypothetical protein
VQARDALLAGLTIMVFVLAVFSASEFITINYLNGELQSQSQANQSGRPFYQSSNVSIAVGCCLSIPPEFVVGDPRANTFVFSVSYGPIISGHGSTVTVVSGENMSIRVYQQNALPVRYQWANFTIVGTFNPNSLNHLNATLFDGAVVMNWLVVSSVLYLHIVTR